MDRRNTSRITSSRSIKSATFHLAGWRLLHQTELPVPLECHALTLNTIELLLSDAVTDTCMLQCSAQFRILFISAHFVAENASHTLASSATVRPTFNVEEEVVVTRNGWTPKEEEDFGVNSATFIFMDLKYWSLYPNFGVSFAKLFYKLLEVYDLIKLLKFIRNLFSFDDVTYVDVCIILC